MATSFSTATIAAPSYTVLDWGHSVATLTVVHLGQPFIARALKHCGMQRIVHGVRQQLKLSAAEAEAILTTYGVSAALHGAGKQTELQSLLTNVAASATRDLVEEIQETLSFMKMQFPEQIPAHLCMVGGGASIRNMDLLLQQQLGLPVSNWTLRGSPSESVSPVFATAAALSALAWEL
jgi:Tfp pilus assembly PilM family ATPase